MQKDKASSSSHKVFWKQNGLRSNILTTAIYLSTFISAAILAEKHICDSVVDDSNFIYTLNKELNKIDEFRP